MRCPEIISKKIHQISPSSISLYAMEIISKLKASGFEAYIVGGGVRDLLLGLPPKDFDVATDAKPDEIKRIFPNCRLIGRRFRLAHIYYRREVIEVATFRADDEALKKDGLIVRDNRYGSIEEDVWRRDFTVNALYYDPEDEVVLDFVGGLRDLKKKRLRIIGDVKTRFEEDPVRMMRAIRFVAKLHLKMDKAIEKAVPQMIHLLAGISPNRLYDEILKLFYCREAVNVFPLMIRYGLFQLLFPQVAPYLKEKPYKKFLIHILESTDRRIRNQQPVIAAFLFSALFWLSFLEKKKELEYDGLPHYFALSKAVAKTFRAASKTVSVPAFVRRTVQDIWELQFRLERRKQNQIIKIMQQKRFRAAFDFLEFRAQTIDKSLKSTAKWWRKIQENEDFYYDQTH